MKNEVGNGAYIDLTHQERERMKERKGSPLMEENFQALKSCQTIIICEINLFCYTLNMDL